jgi:hypothetical protein
MSDLEKKYEKPSRVKEIRQLAKDLEGSDKAAFGIYPNAGKRAKREGPDSAQKAISQAIAGFRSQWSGLDDEGKAGIGKGTPGIYYNTVAIPAIAGVIDEKYAPDFAIEADKKAGKIKEAVRKDMGIDEPKGALEHFAYAGGEMLGQLPVPAGLMAKIVGGAKKMGMAGKVAAAPIEYLSPTIDPKAINYGIGTAFGGTLGTALEPEHKALGGLIQKYENGGKVGRFMSAVDKAIETLKQKKGTGEQILKQLESTPGVKQEELETRGIKQKLQASPKITQEELLKTAKRNKAPIPERTVLGAGVPEDYKPKLKSDSQRLLDEYGIEPVVNPDDRRMMGFMIRETGDIADAGLIKNLYPDEMGFPVDANGKILPEAEKDYKGLLKAVDEAEKYFQNDLMKYETKFQRYSQPGGENYREVLLHLPQSDVQARNLKQNELHDLLNKDLSGVSEEEAGKINLRINQLINDVTDQDEGFRSGHYDTSNILTHFRVSDRKGPSGEKVLYVDEIQSDWHQKARDARKQYIKDKLNDEQGDLRDKAIEELKAAGNDLSVNPVNERELAKVVSRLTKERKAELEKAVPKDFGYRSPEDTEKIIGLRDKIHRISIDGLTPEETAEYFTPGKVVFGYGGYDKVLSFNAGEGSPSYQKAYNEAFQRAESTGVDRNTAIQWATKKAAEKSKYDWSVTVIEVNPKTGEPISGAKPRTHNTSPEKEITSQLRKDLLQSERKVPDAPFKDNWHELAVKEIMDMAAKEGYDRVAFSPGIEQIKRYEQSMRQAVDEIRFAPTPNGEGLMVIGLKGPDTKFTGDVVDGTFISGPAQGKTLSEVFGSNIAKQIEEGSANFGSLPETSARPMPKMSADELLFEHGDEMTPEQRMWLSQFNRRWLDDVDNTPAGEGIAAEMTQEYENWLSKNTLGKSAPAGPGGVIKGDDLTVGGEGMKSFYDKRVPDYVRKYTGKEFGSKGDYMDIQMTEPTKVKPTESQIKRMMEQIDDADDDELMERVMDLSHTRINQELERRGVNRNSPNYDQEFEDLMYGPEDWSARFHDEALRELAIERMNAVEPGKTLRAFTIDVTPKMKEKITTEGQKLFAATPAIGLGATQTQQPAEEAPKEQAPVIQDEPQGFESGGKVGKLTSVIKKASETVFHGGTYVPGEEIKKPLFTSVNKDLANSYTVDDFGKTKGALRALRHDAKKPAGEKELIEIAERLGIDVDFDNSPLSLFDSGIYGKKNVNRLIKELRKEGFDSAEGIDVGAGTPHTDRSTVLFPGTKTMPDEPQGFENGGRVGKVKEAAEGLLRVLHGSPSKVNLEKGKNLDVTTDPGYAVKRAQDKMSMFGQEGPPMVNKFDIPSKRLLRFEETYSPEDVALMRRYFNKLPADRAMTGEEIYDAAMGKDYVLEGIAKAGGLAGYQRPAGGSGGKGDWFRITEQDELTRKARGGLAALQKRYR